MSCNCTNNCHDTFCPQYLQAVTTPCAEPGCDQQLTTDCVIYTGPDLPCLGLTTGMQLTEILLSILYALHPECEGIITTTTTTICPQTYLYNYYTIEDGRNITPAGWHVPSITEWNTLLATQADQTNDLIDPLGWLADGYWGDPNELTNATGLSLRKNNNRKENGLFYYDYYSLYWTTTDQSPGLKHTAGVYGCCGDFYPDDEPKSSTAGIAIRLIKDNSTDTGTMVGNDGRVYPTVKIGTQVWMAEDLKETKYRNGDIIPVVTGNNDWAALTTGARCLFLNEICCNDTNPCIRYIIYNASFPSPFSFEYSQCDGGPLQVYNGSEETYSFQLCAAWNSINVLTGSITLSYNNRCGCGIDLG